MERHQRRKWRSTSKLIGDMPPEIRDKIVGARIGPELVKKTECTKDGYTRLVRDLLSYARSTEARKYVKDYSTRCVSEARTAIDNASVYLYNNRHRIQEHDNPFRHDSAFYGTWWLQANGLTTSFPQRLLRFGVGLLYVRFEPWGSVSLLHIFWDFVRATYISAGLATTYDYNHREPLAYFVQYTFDNKNDMSQVTMELHYRDLAYKKKTESNHPSCLQFPPVEGETFPDMNTMLEQIFHTRSPKLTPIIGDIRHWESSPFLLWTIMNIIDGKAPPDLGVSVDKLSPNEWVIGKNMKRYHRA